MSQLSLFENERQTTAARTVGEASEQVALETRRKSCDGRAPAFWIEEVRLLRTMSARPKQEIRRITLRRGLNVVWAPPLDSDDPDMRFSGHAAGKTSLCRLIRYVLGEFKSGSGFLCDQLHTRLPRGWVVARVWIGNQAWIVARPLTGRRKSVCAQTTDDIDTWLKNKRPGAEDYETFRVTLHQAVVETLPVKTYGDSGQSIRFLHLLAWLTRDQECRLDSLLNWRHQESKAANPTISRDDRQFLVRAIVGIMDREIRREMEHRVSLEADLRKLPSEIAFRQRTVEEAIEELRPFISGETHPNLADPLFTAGLERALDAAEAQELSDLRPTGALTIEEQRRALDRAIESLGAAKHAAATWEKDPCGVEAPLAHQYCPFHVDSPDPLPRKGGLVTRNLKADVDRRLQTTQEGVDTLQADYDTARHLDEVRRRDEEALRHHYRLIREHLKRAVAAQTTLEALVDMRENLTQEVIASQERQDALQQRWNREASQFADVYRGTMQRLLGQGTDANCRFTRETIKLQASCNGDLNSAAINTLVTLGFDFAALRAGVHGQGHHPRFLIHDSPREADIDAHLYRRLFTCAEKLEPDEGEADFQYIITSTEAPPPTLCQEPWLRLKLDASKAEERLFCMDL